MRPNVEQQNLVVQWAAVVFGVIYGLSFNQWISLGVLVTGIFTAAVNRHYKQKNDEREERKLQLLEQQLQLKQQTEDVTP